MQEKLKGVAVATALWVGLITLGNPAKAETFAYKPLGGIITMDVVKANGYTGGGTWLCKSLKECYVKILQAEERGALQYCQTITIKRDGNIVWHRDYNSPYWVQIQGLKGHDRAWR